MNRCQARLTRPDRQCRRAARPGQTTCRQHADRAPTGADPEAIQPATDRRHPAEPADAFYTSALDQAERYDLAAAASVSGIDGEIAVLRLIVRRELRANPDDAARLLRTIEALTRAVRAKYQLSEKRRENLAEALAAVIEELGPAAGPDGDR